MILPFNTNLSNQFTTVFPKNFSSLKSFTMNHFFHSIKTIFSSSYFQSQQNYNYYNNLNTTKNINNNNKSIPQNNINNINNNVNNNNIVSRLLKSTLLISLVFIITIFTLLALFSSPSYSYSSSNLLPSFFSKNPLLSTQQSLCCNLSDPDPGPTNLTHILFGLGGSAKTWESRRAYSQLWWVPNVTRGFVWLDDNPGDLPNSPDYPPFKVSDRARGLILGPDNRPKDSDRMARILKESFELGLPSIKWFVMGDDDTIFFLENLVSVLSKYDYREMYYIGASSESVEQDVMHGFETGFGGGGFAISYGLAWEVVRILDECVNKYHSFYGSDEKVAACVADLGVPLTKEPGFHQLDVRGDPYGLLAAHPVTPLVSLHHLVDAKPLFPGETQVDSLKRLMQAYHVDPALTIQQNFCFDQRRKWSVSISWGYTVQLYPSLIPPKVLSTPLQTFHTWRSGGDGPFVFNTRPMKDDPCERPLIYFLDQVNDSGKGETNSSYKRAAPADGKECEQPAYKLARSVESFTVSASKTGPEKWMKAPRRQCCEILNRWIVRKNMRLKLRSCKPREAIIM